MMSRFDVQEEQSSQLQQEEPSWAMMLLRKGLGMVIGEAYTGPLSAAYLLVGGIGDCWAVFLVTIVLLGFLVPAG